MTSGPLSLRGVEVSLGDRPVLRGVDLELQPGEVLVLAGPNGVGKTTLLRAACGLVSPSRGEVQLAGRPLGAWSRRALARELALVPQETHVPFPFRVDEIVLMGRTPHQGWFGFESADDRRRAHEALDRLALLPLADRSILDLSGGERQLVMVARAMAQDARILLLDEATAHLDLSRRLELLALLREWAAEGRAALAVSHDLALSLRAADRVALLADGRIHLEGPPADVITPATLREVFQIEADVLPHETGPLIVPRPT